MVRLTIATFVLMGLFTSCKSRVDSPQDSSPMGSEPGFTEIGPQVYKAAVNMGDVAVIDAVPYLFTVLQGEPAVFVAVDLDSNTVKAQFPLPGSIVSWIMKVAADNQIYIGTTSQGRLFRYTAFSDAIEEVGVPPGATAIWDLEWVESRKALYGGVSDPGKLFSVEGGAIKDHGVAVEKEMTLRSLAYDPALDRLYAGVGTHAHLVEYDLKAGKKAEVLPAEFKDDSYVYDLDVVDGRLFGKMEPSYRMFVMETKTRKILTTFQCGSRGVSPKSPLDDKVYFTYGGKLMAYDFSDNAVQDVGVATKDNLMNFAFVKLKDSKFSDDTLIGLTTSTGKLLKYNLKTGYHEITQLNLPQQAVLINEIGEAQGKIYSGGYVTGGMGVYDPATGESQSYADMSQPEALTGLGDKVYFAVYPKARVYEYDPKVEWGKGTPTMLFRLDGEAKQNRPLVTATSEDLRALFIGTAPEYGHLGGALAVYHQDTKELETYRDIVPDQSVASLVYQDGFVVGGTTVWGGEGIQPKSGPAKLFIWDVKQKKKVFEISPTSASIVSALAVAPDKKIWGMSGGTLFIFDVAQKKIVSTKSLFKGTVGRHKGAKMAFHKNGHLYGTVNGSVFSVHPTTQALTILKEDVGATSFALGKDGGVYFKIKNSLWRYQP